MLRLADIRAFFKPSLRLEPEAYEAYLFRLPEQIEVAWFRDGSYIIGRISDANKRSYMTQAMNGAEFIEMVNDAVYAMYEIPREYIDLMKSNRAFMAPVEELRRLDDGSIANASIHMQKRLVTAA